jgi:hypothetical protein
VKQLHGQWLSDDDLVFAQNQTQRSESEPNTPKSSIKRPKSGLLWETPDKTYLNQDRLEFGGKRNGLDDLVRRPGEAGLDAFALDHRTDLADSLPDHLRHILLRFCAGDSRQSELVGRLAFRHQPRGEPDFYAH